MTVGTELNSEQVRIVKQLRRHVSAVLADEVYAYFRQGADFDDLLGNVIRETDELRAMNRKTGE
jgi:hypothetical protein